MIVLLILITLLFLALNYELSNHDYMHPAVVLYLVFFAYEIVCLCGTSAYDISLHAGSISILMIGFSSITVANFLSRAHKKEKELVREELKEIIIPKVYLVILIALQALSILFFYKYLKSLAAAYGGAYGGTPGSFSGMIKLYDTLTKFWTSIYNQLAVPIPMVYRITNPICAGAEYIVLYCMVNNFLVNKRKIDLLAVLVLILMCVRIIINGSRSPLLRIFTFVILLVYVMNYRRGKIRKGNVKFLCKLIVATIGVVVAMFLVLIIMGRTAGFTGIGDQLFVYLGAPIVNLDTFVEGNPIKIIGAIDEEALFGAQTFHRLYAYIGKLFKITEYTKIGSISSFAFSNNGREIGNVYTMFYKIVYDFGYFGVFPITFVMGIYYCGTYRKIMLTKIRRNKVIDFRLLVYAYLFNDVVMSAFSNRFYETVLDAPFIKFILVVWVLDYFLVEKKISFGSTKLYFRKHSPV